MMDAEKLQALVQAALDVDGGTELAFVTLHGHQFGPIYTVQIAPKPAEEKLA
jgi:hypothetical protein